MQKEKKHWCEGEFDELSENLLNSKSGLKGNISPILVSNSYGFGWGVYDELKRIYREYLD